MDYGWGMQQLDGKQMPFLKVCGCSGFYGMGGERVTKPCAKHGGK